MHKTLDIYVVDNYGSVLTEVGLSHVGYFADQEAFGNETDRYRNDHMIVDFMCDYHDHMRNVHIIPVMHQDDRFDLTYLLAMMEPQVAITSISEAVMLLPKFAAKIYAMFGADQYVCYRRAYLSFENCRNLWRLSRSGITLRRVLSGRICRLCFVRLPIRQHWSGDAYVLTASAVPRTRPKRNSI